MKKIISLIILLCMTITLSVTCYAELIEMPTIQFHWNDVTENDWYYYAACQVHDAYDRCFSYTHWYPSGQVKRIEIVSYFSYLDDRCGLPWPTAKPHPFTDLDNYDVNTNNDIDRIYELGVMEGVSETEFDPEGYLTREQLATYLFRLSTALVGYPDFCETYDHVDITTKASLDTFPDADEVSDFAVDAMEWAYGTGLMIGRGTPAGVYLSPKETLTHAELLNIMYRYYVYFKVEM